MDAMDGRSDDRAEEVVDVIAQLMPVVTQIDPEALDAALDVLVERARAGRAGDEPSPSSRRGTVPPG